MRDFDFGPGFGPGAWRQFRRAGRVWGHGHAHGFGPFGRERGSLRYDILAALYDGPRHGYDIMQAIEERRGFRPSPGSIYPALQLLEDEGYVQGREVDGKRVYVITEKGSELLAKHREENPEAHAAGPAPYAEVFMRGMAAMHGAKDALKQIARSGNLELMKRAVDTLERARKELYSILADNVL